MDPNVVAASVGGVSAIVVGWFSARAATRAALRKTDSDERVAVQQIEAGAFGRAKEFYETTLTRMQTEIDRQARQIGTLQRKVDAQQRTITAWGEQMTMAGLVPVTVPDDGGGRE